MGGDAVVLALDAAGTVSFWRLLELVVGRATTIKLALQGSMALGSQKGPRFSLCGSFLDACFVCIHPQQQAQFVVLSTAGVRQANRQRSNSVANGPNALALQRGGSARGPRREPLAEEQPEAAEAADVEELEPMQGMSQPCTAAFNPFFPGLLLVAYASGDLALFDCSLCVPLTHWGGVVARSGRITVAWSPVRPCVFFAKAGAALDIWDLAERTYAPVLTVDLAGPPPDGEATPFCSELYVSSNGQPVIGHGSGAIVMRLPLGLSTPMQVPPPKHSQAVTPVDSLLKTGCEKASVFPTLSGIAAP